MPDGSIFDFLDEVEDTTVGSVGEGKFYFQFEVGELVFGDNVAAEAVFFATGVIYHELPIFDPPAFGRKGLFVVAAPFVGRGAVEKNFSGTGEHWLFLRLCIFGCGLSSFRGGVAGA